MNHTPRIGTHAVIQTKEGKLIKGMIKSILKQTPKQTIVELLGGSIGILQRTIQPVKIIHTKKIPQKKKVLHLHIPTKKEENTQKEETQTLEYKRSALWSQDLTKKELDNLRSHEIRRYGNKASKIIIAKTLAAFLNTNGGTLIIGIQEHKDGTKNEIIGIEQEIKKLRNKDYGKDGYKRMIIDDIIKPYLPETIFHHLNKYLDITFTTKENKTLCNIQTKKSDHEVFITIDNKDHFYIKVDSQTRELQGKQLINYIKTHWK